MGRNYKFNDKQKIYFISFAIKKRCMSQLKTFR